MISNQYKSETDSAIKWWSTIGSFFFSVDKKIISLTYIVRFVTVTGCLSAIPDIVRYHLHLRLLVIDWAMYAALSPWFVVVWCRWLFFLSKTHVPRNIGFPILSILSTLLWGIVRSRLLDPISSCIIPFRSWCVYLSLWKDFGQLFWLRVLLITKEIDVIQLFLPRLSQKLCLLPIICGNLVRLIVQFEWLF